MGRREQAEASRAALVAAARACFTESGYDGTTVAEVLRRAGMARGALYHYFPGGKDELFAVVYRDVDDELHRRVDALEASESPLAALRESAVVFLRLCTRDDFARITVLEGPRVMADSATPHGSVLGRSYDRMHDGVAAAAAAGEITDLDVDALTTAVYGAVRDLGARVATAKHRRKAADEAVAVLDLVLAGLAAPRSVRSMSTRTARQESA
jgi:AcrR family transcriptional regulator